jgi:cell division protein FtsB
LKQGEELSTKQQELSGITVENAELEQKRDALYSPEKIEQLARENYGFVRPGEEAFAVPPPAPEPVRLPANWPFTHLAQTLGG